MRLDDRNRGKVEKFNLFFSESSICVKKIDECMHKRLQYLEKLTEGKPEKKAIKGKSKPEVNFLK